MVSTVIRNVTRKLAICEVAIITKSASATAQNFTTMLFSLSFSLYISTACRYRLNRITLTACVTYCAVLRYVNFLRVDSRIGENYFTQCSLVRKTWVTCLQTALTWSAAYAIEIGGIIFRTVTARDECNNYEIYINVLLYCSLQRDVQLGFLLNGRILKI